MMMMGGNNQFTTQNEGGGSLGSNGMNNGGVGIGREGEIVLEKGSWTVAEYVRSHGEGNWNVVQKNTGLTHCGKSCRLRWTNHLSFVMVFKENDNEAWWLEVFDETESEA
ncbi:hypothetical protein Gogos_020571 [Gossypium gossypioides]|uniref:Myb-like domain-containing protein n=1 Tax=Gossypium gossypioides TaxID=34282 RepID=A0A7J9D1M4_GOSGO|nr:hypothetical protein [Gossypium gossypioides]